MQVTLLSPGKAQDAIRSKQQLARHKNHFSPKPTRHSQMGPSSPVPRKTEKPKFSIEDKLAIPKYLPSIREVDSGSNTPEISRRRLDKGPTQTQKSRFKKAAKEDSETTIEGDSKPDSSPVLRSFPIDRLVMLDSPKNSPRVINRSGASEPGNIFLTESPFNQKMKEEVFSKINDNLSYMLEKQSSDIKLPGGAIKNSIKSIFKPKDVSSQLGFLKNSPHMRKRYLSLEKERKVKSVHVSPERGEDNLKKDSVKPRSLLRNKSLDTLKNLEKLDDMMKFPSLSQ